MVNYYKFSVIQLAPDSLRDERVNIGLAVFLESGIDLRLTKKLEKARVLSYGINTSSLRVIVDELRNLNDRLDIAIEASERVKILSKTGLVTLSNLGSFVAKSANEYEERIATAMRTLVEAEPAPVRQREKKSKLLTQVKYQFRADRVLARKGEDLSSHRIVSGYELEKGLVADLVLQNGTMHVVETVDASNEDESIRRAVSDIAVSALVLETARMKFGVEVTKTRLVYQASSYLERITKPSLDAAEHQGAILTNWASADARLSFLHSLAHLATPIETKKRLKKVVSGTNVTSFL